MVEVWHDWRWEKRNRTNFYRVMLLVCIVVYNLGHFGIKIIHKEFI